MTSIDDILRGRDAEESAARRAKNRDDSAALLKKYGVPFTTKNDGVHLMIQRDSMRIDFWPGTGLWIFGNSPSTRRSRRGVFNLLKFLGKELDDVDKNPA